MIQLKDITNKSLVEQINDYGSNNKVLNEEGKKEEPEVKTKEETKPIKLDNPKTLVDELNGQVGEEFIILSTKVTTDKLSKEERSKVRKSPEYQDTVKYIKSIKPIKCEGTYGGVREDSYIVKLDSIKAKDVCDKLKQESFIQLIIQDKDSIRIKAWSIKEDLPISKDNYEVINDVNNEVVYNDEIEGNDYTKIVSDGFKFTFPSLFNFEKNKEDELKKINSSLDTEENSEMKLKEQSLTEMKVQYRLKCGPTLRAAVEAGETDENGEYSEVRTALIDAYKELYDNDVIDEYDFNDYTEQIEEDVFDDEDNVEGQVQNFFDLCDNLGV